MKCYNCAEFAFLCLGVLTVSCGLLWRANLRHKRKNSVLYPDVCHAVMLLRLWNLMCACMCECIWWLLNAVVVARQPSNLCVQYFTACHVCVKAYIPLYSAMYPDVYPAVMKLRLWCLVCACVHMSIWWLLTTVRMAGQVPNLCMHHFTPCPFARLAWMCVYMFSIQMYVWL